MYCKIDMMENLEIFLDFQCLTITSQAKKLNLVKIRAFAWVSSVEKGRAASEFVGRAVA
jgi:hypothetical protein